MLVYLPRKVLIRSWDCSQQVDVWTQGLVKMTQHLYVEATFQGGCHEHFWLLTSPGMRKNIHDTDNHTRNMFPSPSRIFLLLFQARREIAFRQREGLWVLPWLFWYLQPSRCSQWIRVARQWWARSTFQSSSTFM